jgi:hypothetical protein
VSEEIKDRIRKELEGLSAGPLKALIDDRAESQAQLARLKENLIDSERKRDACKLEIEQGIRDAVDELADGLNPMDKQRSIRMKENQLRDTEAWIKQMREMAIPQAEAALKAKEATLAEAIRREVQSLKPAFEEEMDRLISAGMQVLRSWIDQTKEFYAAMGVRLPAGSMDAIPKISRHNSQLDLYIQNVGIGHA